MKLAEGIEALELTSDFAGRRMTIYPALFTDHEGPTLVDTGMPGQLLGPGEANTPDMERALLSVREVAGLEVDMVLCYHGGPYGPGAGRRLREIAGR